MPGEQPRRDLSDLANPERVDEAVERDIAPRLDRSQEFRHRLLAPAFALLDLLPPVAQPEDVGRSGNQPVGEEGLNVLGAQPLDVEGIAADEMPQAFQRLRRADQPTDRKSTRLNSSH